MKDNKSIRRERIYIWNNFMKKTKITNNRYGKTWSLLLESGLYIKKTEKILIRIK